jgi:hypothetical protein
MPESIKSTEVETCEERQPYVLAAQQASALGWVYFVRGADLVKIGQTMTQPRKRFWGIQCMSPVPLVMEAVAPDAGQEGILHIRFADSRSHGEWFRSSSELETLIAETVERYGAPEERYGIPVHLFNLALADVLDRKHHTDYLGRIKQQARQLERKLGTPGLTERERDELYRSTTLLKNAYIESKFGVALEPHG